MLIGVISGPSFAQAKHQMEASLPYVDGLELRLDLLADDALCNLKALTPLPAIYTLRGKQLHQFESYLNDEPPFCDIEWDTDPSLLHRIKTRYPSIQLIGSYHNFHTIPHDLDGLFQQMQNPHFTHYKIAAYAHSTPDMLRLMRFAIRSHATCIAMGEYGTPSRILGPVIGNAFNYASIEEEPTLGRPSLQTLCQGYRYRHLNAHTQLFALLGDPIAHSLSPAFHNQQFQNTNSVYIKLTVTPSELFSTLSQLQQLPFKGLSITRPLKEAILPFLNRIDPTAQQIGAVNTILIQNGLHGFNTDAPGALRAIEKHLPLPNLRIALLGAGGSARAIAYEALRRGAQVTLFNRTFSRAQILAQSLHCQAASLHLLDQHPYDLLINTIPHDLSLTPTSAVMDIRTSPKETPLLLQAKQNGHLCIYGEEMFIEQAKLQQEIWSRAKT
jgi:3-dehydroquinate dehydratase/shikimate dehydrogenase